MVIVFPMLVSQSVSENVIPGICKSVEGYLIVNHMSDIMDNPEVKRSGFMKGFRTTKKGWFARESENLLEISDEERERLVGKGGTKNKIDQEILKRDQEIQTLKRDLERVKNKARTDEEMKKEVERLAKQRDDLEKRNRERRKERQAQIDIERKREEEDKKREEEELKKRETTASAKITTRDYKSISLEPSYIEVETTLKSGAIKKEFIGIKVIPYRVISSEKLSRLILHDAQLNFLTALMVSFGRKIIRSFYKLLDKWTGRLRLGGLTVSGDPRRDVIMNRTGRSGHGIIVLNKTEDIDERFLKNIARVNRLFKMGWGNIIIADDISRQAYFCMKGYGGTCQVLSYAMIYQNLGQLKVYDSLEDATRQNSSLFKISKSARKIFSEWKIESKLLKYISEDK